MANGQSFRMSFFLINLFLIIIIIFLLIILSMVWPPDSPWSPWWRTSKKVARAACKLAKITKEDVVYELGSGDAMFLITAAKEFGARGVGIEIDILRALFSTLMIRIIRVSKKVKIKRKNFFDEDLSSATVVFVYLVPKALGRLLPKFKRELKKGTRIVSLKYEIDLPLVAFDKTHNLRLYKIPEV